jgi:hypothetical protein
VVDTPATRGLAARVGAELRASGFALLFERAETAPSRQELERAALRRGAVAVLRLERSARGVEVWAWDRATRKLVLRELLSGDGDEGELALRAVEVLRASLLEARDPPARTRIEPPSGPALALTQRPTNGWSARIDASAMASVSPGGFGPFAHLALGVGVAHRAGVSFGLEAIAPLSGSSVRGPEGEATLRAVMASAWVAARVSPAHWRVELSLRAGASLAWIDVQGTASAGYSGATATGIAGLPWGAARALYWVSPRFSPWIELRAGATTSAQRVLFAGRPAAEWGIPWASMSLGVCLSLG